MKSKIGKLGEVILLQDLDRTLAIAGVVFSVFLIIYMVITAGRWIYLLAGVLFLISCLLWLGMRKSHLFEFHFYESGSQFTFLAICYFILYILSILSVYFRQNFYERPLLYFILTAVMAGFIACEILISGKHHVGLILTQCVLLGLSVAWSQLLIFPSLVGVDPWYHYAFTNQILGDFHIPDGESYSKLPIFHLMIAITSLLTNLPYKFAVMVSVSLGQILCNALFLYLIARSLFKNQQVALLTALLVTIANTCIFMSYWSIPNSFAAVFMPIAFYILLFKVKGKARILFTSLVAIMMVMIILGHTITAMCMAIFLFAVWFSFRVYRIFFATNEAQISLLFPVSFVIFMFSWWTYVSSGSFGALAILIKDGFSINFFSNTPPEFQNYLMTVPINEQVFNNLGMFLFFTLSFIGIFSMISRKGNSYTFIFAWLGLIPLAISFFALISMLSIIEQRWWYFAQIFLSIPLAVGLIMLVTWKCKRNISMLVFIFIMVVPLCFFNIMSPDANVDNHFFSSESSMTSTLTGSEIVSIFTIFNFRENVILTDEYYAGSQKYVYHDLQPFDQEISYREFDKLHGKTVLIRKNILGRPFKLYANINKLDYNLISAMEQNTFSKIFDSNSVYAYA